MRDDEQTMDIVATNELVLIVHGERLQLNDTPSNTRLLIMKLKDKLIGEGKELSKKKETRMDDLFKEE